MTGDRALSHVDGRKTRKPPLVRTHHVFLGRIDGQQTQTNADQSTKPTPTSLATASRHARKTNVNADAVKAA